MKPEQDDRRHSVVPLSIARLEDGKFSDLSGLNLAEAEARDWPEAPAFQIDWKDKDWELVNTLLNQQDAKPRRRLLVRTAINSRTQTAAEGQLFSMECVVPEGFVWRGVIGLEAVPAAERKAAWQAVQQLLNQGLSGLGKTKAALTNCRSFPVNSGEDGDRLPGEHITLCMLTPARLFPLGWERDTPGLGAMALYAAYWEQVSAGSLQLSHCFARQERQGGAYHYYRFQHADRGCYAPEWLTLAGSVFVLKVLDKTRVKTLTGQWLQQGLPVPEGATVTWEQSPYLPEHGYGEVCVDWQPLPAYPGFTTGSEPEAGQ